MFKPQYGLKSIGNSIDSLLRERSFSTKVPSYLDDNSINYLNVNINQDEIEEYRLVMIELIKHSNLAKTENLTQKIGRILLDDETIIRQSIISHNDEIFQFILNNASPEYLFNYSLLKFLITNANKSMVEGYCKQAGELVASILLNSSKIIQPIIERNDAEILAIFINYQFIDINAIGENMLKSAVKENKLNIVSYLLKNGISASREYIIEKSALEVAFQNYNFPAIELILKLDKTLSLNRKKILEQELNDLH